MAPLELAYSSQLRTLQPRDELVLCPVAQQDAVVETYLFLRQESSVCGLQFGGLGKSAKFIMSKSKSRTFSVRSAARSSCLIAKRLYSLRLASVDWGLTYPCQPCVVKVCRGKKTH